jgi:hypothetical protein
MSVEPPEKLGNFQREHPELCAWCDLGPVDTDEIERVFPGLSLTAAVKEAYEEAGRSATADTVGLTKLGALFALEANRDDWRRSNGLRAGGWSARKALPACWISLRPRWKSSSEW